MTDRSIRTAISGIVAGSIIAIAATSSAFGQSNSEGAIYSGILASLQAKPALRAISQPVTSGETIAAADTAPRAADSHAGHRHGVNAVNSSIPCVADLAMVADRARVNFASGSAELDRYAKESILVLASMAQTCPQARVLIEGYADPVGNAEYNLTLSWRRANVVLEAIRAAGFPTDTFHVYSHLTDHDDETCKHFNVVDRRTEFVVVPRTSG